MNIIKIIKENKDIILISVLLAICLYIVHLKYIEPMENTDNNQEEEEQEEQELEEDEIEKHVNKMVYLKNKDKDGNEKYLALVNLEACDNEIKRHPRECFTNIAILQNGLKKNCIFKLGKINMNGTHSFRLISTIDGKEFVLDQHLFIKEKKPRRKVCVDNYNPITDFIKNTFNLQEDNGKYRIIFKKSEDSNKKYYLGLCKGKKNICNYNDETYKRLCIKNNQSNSLELEIVNISDSEINDLPISPKKEVVKDEETTEENNIEPFFVSKNGNVNLVTANGNLIIL
jgi:hypothetical protein